MTERSPLADVIGVFYDTDALVSWLAISESELLEQVEERRVLGCKTSDGHWVFPGWQFDDEGRVIRGVADTLNILTESMDAWSTAHWFVVPSPDLPDSQSAIEWLSAGRDPRPVLREARRDSRRQR